MSLASWSPVTGVVLGSSSPRRAELLRQIGVPFRVLAGSIDETLREQERPSDYVDRMAQEKLAAVREAFVSLVPEAPVILCADTIVVLEDRILGKPRDQADGIEMLMALSGRAHGVVTAVAIARGAEQIRFAVETIVFFRRLTKQEAKFYWASGEPLDKAGGYGIQGLGAVLVEKITGSYSNVVGLPLLETSQALRDFGVDCLAMAGQRAHQNFI